MSSIHPTLPGRRVRALSLVLLTALVTSLLPAAVSAKGKNSKLDYPKTERVEHVDVYHGTEVADPYRWLEEDVRVSERAAKWVAAENKVTFDYLESIPERGRIAERLTELWNYERYSTPFKAGGRYYYSKNDGLQNQSVVYTIKSLDDEHAHIVLDPNAWSADGTVALAGFSPSPDGRYLAYGVAEAGSDWRKWKLMDLETGETLGDELRWIKFSGASWTHDGKGFFYSRYPEPEEGAEYQSLNLHSKVYFHRVGTPQSDDILVHQRPDHPEWGFFAQVTEDDRYLLIVASIGTDARYRVLVKDLTEPFAMARPLVEGFDNEYALVGNDGPIFYFRVDVDAPKGRLIAMDIRRPAPEHWREILPETANVLQDVNLVGNLFVARYLEDAKTRVRILRLNGEAVRDVDFPTIGSAFGFGGDREDFETFYQFSSFAAPPSIYRYDLLTGGSKLMRRAEVDFDPEDYEVKQVFYESKDGTRVPMFIAHKKGIELDGNNPTLLYGYGGFAISLTPSFSVSRLAWMEMGGVFAMPNLRGGAEYGEDWHQAGTKLHKQNVFDDFLAAAEWLVANHFTRPEKLAIHGRSNGGLLVGAAMTQRPDLFGAALPEVGVMDMLRFHQFTAGRFWVDDYGSADDPEEFKALRAYSPYHNLKPNTDYPATLVTTADTDDRVVPGHSFKFAARLQASHTGEDPVLIRIETRAGHGGGTPTSKIIEATADLWSFLVDNLDMELPPKVEQTRLN